MHVLIVDDIANDRLLTIRIFRKQGWRVHEAASILEALNEFDQLQSTISADELRIVLDLHMPDPTIRTAGDQRLAGARLALLLRQRMSTPIPIIALTAMTEATVHSTALTLGCDAVFLKPATSDLPAHIATFQAQIEPPGTTPALQMMRSMIARDIESQLPATKHVISESDLTKALLAYRREGLFGLGESVLALALFPQISSVEQRGTATLAHLQELLVHVRQLRGDQTARLLAGELALYSPEQNMHELGVSKSEYYRRRSEAASVMIELLMRYESMSNQ